jgi:hypothetical protein
MKTLDRSPWPSNRDEARFAAQQWLWPLRGISTPKLGRSPARIRRLNPPHVVDSARTIWRASSFNSASRCCSATFRCRRISSPRARPESCRPPSKPAGQALEEQRQEAERAEKEERARIDAQIDAMPEEQRLSLFERAKAQLVASHPGMAIFFRAHPENAIHDGAVRGRMRQLLTQGRESSPAN